MTRLLGRGAIVFLLAAAATSDMAAAAAKKSDPYCRPQSGVDMVDVSSVVDDRFAAQMKTVGISVVGRYYDYQDETLPGKRLRAEELPILRKYGLKLIVVFQHNNNRPETFKDWKNRGPNDAAEALKLARGFSQPAGSAIYFGVDGDFAGAGPADLSDDVKNYFRQIKMQFANQNAGYDIGVYGSGAVCNLLQTEGLAKYCWISQSHGFLGTEDNLAKGRYDIEQYLPGTCGGKSVDFDSFRPGVSNVGQFATP